VFKREGNIIAYSHYPPVLLTTILKWNLALIRSDANIISVRELNSLLRIELIGTSIRIYLTLAIIVLKSKGTPVNVTPFKKLLRLLESRDNPV
jgi:hypothetical protein